MIIKEEANNLKEEIKKAKREAIKIAIKEPEQTELNPSYNSVKTELERWIPVSERLPDEFTDVLCNTDSEEIFIATYLGKMNDGTDCFDDHDGMMWEGDVIAWMPLPTSYQCK